MTMAHVEVSASVKNFFNEACTFMVSNILVNSELLLCISVHFSGAICTSFFGYQ